MCFLRVYLLSSVPASFGFVLFLGGVRCIVGASDSFRSTCSLAFDFVFSLVADLSFMLKGCYFLLDLAFGLSMQCGFAFASDCVPI